jgi:hypothetical protein
MHAVQVQCFSKGRVVDLQCAGARLTVYTKQQKHSLFQPGNKGDNSPEIGILATSFVCGGHVDVLSQ